MQLYKLIPKPELWLTLIALGISTLNLVALYQANKPELLNISFLLWITVFTLIWERRTSISFRSGIFSSFLGATLIALILLRTISPSGYNFRVSPIISFVGLVLLISGIKQIHQYKREILILSLPIISAILEGLLNVINLSLMTAKFSAFILWYLGLDIQREGLFLILPTGKVEVYSACSGITTILMMFNISVLFTIIFPIPWLHKIFCVINAGIIGFMVNAVRVALMAVLVAYSHPESFKYWHGGDGALIFSVVAVLIFSLFCWLLYFNKNKIKEPNSKAC